MENIPKYITPEEVKKLNKEGVDFVVDTRGTVIETDSNPDKKIREEDRFAGPFKDWMRKRRNDALRD